MQQVLEVPEGTEPGVCVGGREWLDLTLKRTASSLETESE